MGSFLRGHELGPPMLFVFSVVSRAPTEAHLHAGHGNHFRDESALHDQTRFLNCARAEHLVTQHLCAFMGAERGRHKLRMD